jgi:hypothetical protein
VSGSKLVSGARALHLAEHHGRTLFVRNDQRGWIKGDAHTLPRALRIGVEHSWIYGAEPVRKGERCEGCK